MKARYSLTVFVLLLLLSVQVCAAETTAGTAEITEEMKNPEEGSLPRWILEETEEYRIELTDFIDPGEGYAQFLITVRNSSNYSIYCETDNILLNGQIHLSGGNWCKAGPGESDTTVFTAINDPLAEYGEEIGEIRELSFTMETDIIDPSINQAVSAFQKRYNIVIPEDVMPAIGFDPALSMRAERQILSEDENIRIELLGLGHSPEESDYYALTMLVRVENKTDHNVPVRLSGIMINGYYFDLFSDGNGDAPAGTDRYLMSRCTTSDLEAAGIEEITNVELLILTSEEENTSAYQTEGGTWYPVALSESAPVKEEESDLPIYEDDYVRMAFRKSWTEWKEDYGWGYYHWVLIVTNKSGQNIELSLNDIQLNGISDHDERFGGEQVVGTSADLGSGTRILMDMKQKIYENNGGPVPELSFHVRVRTMGGSRLLHSASDRVVIE